MPSDPANTNPPLDEELVAYLDGELDSKAAARIEQLLASDPAVRRKLQEMDRTWALLDQLDGSQVGEGFTHSTLEMVAVAAADEVRQSQSMAPVRRRRRWLAAVAGLALAGAAGFLGVRFCVPDANRQLLRDLPVLENLDQYRQVDNVEFLRMLRREKLFLEDENDAP